MGQAPAAILKCDAALKANPHKPKSYRFSGIVGDSAHGFGYHLSPRDISGWDYSLQSTRDKAGAKTYPNYASAWDLSFNPTDMKLVTNRLLKACKANDSRVKAIREFCGTLDGHNTYPWDHHDNTSEGVGSWDDSHLWHVHISFYRDVCNNYDALKGVVDVICGIAAKPTVYVPPKFPLGVTNWFSQVRNNRHPAVRTIQNRLVDLGYAGKVNRSTWVDGYYGPETTAAIKLVKKHSGIKGWTNGGVATFTWNYLFTKAKKI